MAKTYYKVQPVAAQTQINWAEVGKNFSDMLAEDKRVRDEKRAALDEMSREAVNVINNVEDGQDATANQWWLTAGGQIQDAMLMANGLLKSGQISANQFVKMQQNVNDGTDGLIGVFEKFNADYDLKKQRMDCTDPEGVGCSQKLEYWAMEQLEGMGNFQNTAVVVNPETLMLSVVDLVDGKIVNDPNKVRSINSLQTMAGSEFNLFDLDAATSAFAEKTGKWKQVIAGESDAIKKGIDTIVSNPMFKGFDEKNIKLLEDMGVSPEIIAELQAQGNIYFAAEEQLVQTIMADNLQSTSILTDNIGLDDNGNDYDFTFNKERGENEILMKQEGGFLVPDFTDEIGKRQLEKVEKFIKTDTRNQLDSDISTKINDTYRTKSSSGRYNAALYGQEQTEENQGELAKSIYNYITSNDAESMERLAQTVISYNPNIKRFSKQADGYVITRRNMSTGKLIVDDPVPISGTPEQIVSILLNKISPKKVTNPTEIVKNNVNFLEDVDVNTTLFSEKIVEEQDEKIGVSIDRDVMDRDLGNFYVEDDENTVASNINQFINNLPYKDFLLGLKAEGTGGPFSPTDNITLKDGDGNLLYEFNGDEKDIDTAAIQNKILNVVAAQLKKNQSKRSEIARYLDVQQTGGTGGKRSVADIMRENGVSRKEAAVIFKKENQ